jgi:hypothetical protein
LTGGELGTPSAAAVLPETGGDRRRGEFWDDVAGACSSRRRMVREEAFGMRQLRTSISAGPPAARGMPRNRIVDGRRLFGSVALAAAVAQAESVAGSGSAIGSSSGRAKQSLTGGNFWEASRQPSPSTEPTAGGSVASSHQQVTAAGSLAAAAVARSDRSLEEAFFGNRQQQRSLPNRSR